MRGGLREHQKRVGNLHELCDTLSSDDLNNIPNSNSELIQQSLMLLMLALSILRNGILQDSTRQYILFRLYEVPPSVA